MPAYALPSSYQTRYAGAVSIGFGGLTLREREGGSVLVLEDGDNFSAADKDDASFLITTWQEARAPTAIVVLLYCMYSVLACIFVVSLLFHTGHVKEVYKSVLRGPICTSALRPKID